VCGRSRPRSRAFEVGLYAEASEEKELDDDVEEDAAYPGWHYAEYGSKEKAMKRFKELGPLIDRRLQHKMWVKTQRKAV